MVIPVFIVAILVAGMFCPLDFSKVVRRLSASLAVGFFAITILRPTFPPARAILYFLPLVLVFSLVAFHEIVRHYSASGIAFSNTACTLLCIILIFSGLHNSIKTNYLVNSVDTGFFPHAPDVVELLSKTHGERFEVRSNPPRDIPIIYYLLKKGLPPDLAWGEYRPEVPTYFMSPDRSSAEKFAGVQDTLTEVERFDGYILFKHFDP